MYVNGVSKGTTTHVQSNYDQTIYVGVAAGSTIESASYMKGNIADARIVKGTAVYTGNFTPPTGPLTQTGGTYPSTTNVNTSITSGHTKLLLPCDDASIMTNHSRLEIYGLLAFASSSTQTKFGSTSIKYNGSDARAFLRSGNFLTSYSEFTVECWVYKDATGTAIILDARPSNSGAPLVSRRGLVGVRVF